MLMIKLVLLMLQKIKVFHCKYIFIYHPYHRHHNHQFIIIINTIFFFFIFLINSSSLFISCCVSLVLLSILPDLFHSLFSEFLIFLLCHKFNFHHRAYNLYCIKYFVIFAETAPALPEICSNSLTLQFKMI